MLITFASLKKYQLTKMVEQNSTLYIKACLEIQQNKIPFTTIINLVTSNLPSKLSRREMYLILDDGKYKVNGEIFGIDR